MFANIYFIMLLCAVLLLLAMKNHSHHLRQANRNAWLWLLALVLSFFFVYAFLVPNVHRVIGDEPSMLTAANNYAGGFQENGSVLAIYHISYALFGQSNTVAIKANLFLSLLNLFLLFALGTILFKNGWAGLAASGLLASSASYAFMATSAYNAIAALFYMLLSAICFSSYLKDGRYVFAVLAFPFSGLASFSRLECAILFPLYLFFWLQNQWSGDVRISLRSLTKGALLLLIGGYFFMHLYSIILDKRAMWSLDPRVSYDFGNLLSNLRWFYHSELLLMIFICTALLVFFIAALNGGGRLREIIFLSSISFCLTAFYLFNSYFDHHFFVLVAPFVFLPLAFVILKAFQRRHTYLIIALLAIFVVSSTFNAVLKVRQQDDYRPHLNLLTRSPQIISEYVGRDCIVVTTYAPNVMMGTGIRAISIQEYIAHPSSSKCTYFFEDYLCNERAYEGGKIEHCILMKDSFQMAPKLEIIDMKAGQKATIYVVGADSGPSVTSVYI